MKIINLNIRYLVILTLCFNSCVNNKIIVYSDNRYQPIKKVETNSYKSPQEREGQDKNNVLGIAISGGGSRAQYFGLGVLISLDELKKGDETFLNEIDYLSTVSGGGFAAGYYLTLKKNDVLDKTFLDFWKSDYRKKRLQEFLFMSAKTTSVFKLPRYEKNKVRKNYPNMIDYELLQSGKINPKNDKTINRLFLSDFFIPASSNEKVTMPMFVTNGTIYNNGERLPFMPHIIDAFKINGSILPNEPFTMNKGFGLPLSYAISGSAAFPGVLPMLKFSLENNPDSVIRVIDGGAVDNLGFTTLFELLDSDTLDDVNKKALIVDCGGFGNEIQKQKNNRVKIGKLLKKSLLYTVDINLLNSSENIKYLAKYYNIQEGNIQRIGFSTIKNKFIELESIADQSTKEAHNQLKERIKSKKMNWEDVYRDFASRNGFDVNNLSEIPSDKFQNFTMKDVFELFELASQVDTKIKIYPWEREILVLAGRYAVYLQRNEIVKLL
nr:patatin-like phospholipase family protein [uncultured Fluviicola sp.]